MPDRWPEIVGHSSLVAARFCFLGYNTHLWRGSKVVMQRPAKPCTPVRSRPPPPVFEKSAAALFSFAAFVSSHGHQVFRIKLRDSCFKIAQCPSGEIGRHIGLKIRRFQRWGVPVRFRPRAPIVSQATPKFDHKPSPFIGNWVFYCLQMPIVIQ